MAFKYSKIEKLLKKNGITANKLASETGIPQTTIASWKSGASPRVDLIAKVADYFDVSIEYFLK